MRHEQSNDDAKFANTVIPGCATYLGADPTSSFRGARSASPESIPPRSLRPNGFRVRAAARPGMTMERAVPVGLRHNGTTGKNSASHGPQISGLSAPSRALSEGRIMVVTKRWRGMRWTQAVSKTSDTDADGKAVWSWRPTLASSPLEFIHRATVANKPDHRGERGISRKPLCRGCPGASAEPVCSCAHFSLCV